MFPKNILAPNLLFCSICNVGKQIPATSYTENFIDRVSVIARTIARFMTYERKANKHGTYFKYLHS